MPSPSQDRTHNLGDFAEFISAINLEGFEFVVIGGCAVGAYSHFLNEPCFTVDLDILTTRETMDEILDWARCSESLEVLKVPRARAVQVAVLNWKGLEINILTKSRGLPSAAQTFQNSRVFKLSARGSLEVPVADPFDLLSNKLSVNRSKDQPHIKMLQMFLDDEVATAFAEKGSPRERLAPARRLLRVLETKVLPIALAERLIKLAKTPVDFRFLVNHVPKVEQALALIEKSPAEARESLEVILANRRWEEES